MLEFNIKCFLLKYLILHLQKRELEDKIRQRRKEREQQEEKEAWEREKKRIQMGQEIAERKRRCVFFYWLYMWTLDFITKCIMSLVRLFYVSWLYCARYF